MIFVLISNLPSSLFLNHEVVSVHQGDQTTLLVVIDARAVFGLVRLALVHERPDLFLEVRGGVARAV